MKCKVFTGKWNEAMDAFNNWAKGKALRSDVIIHTLIHPRIGTISGEVGLLIVVYHPEGLPWEGAAQ